MSEQEEQPLLRPHRKSFLRQLCCIFESDEEEQFLYQPQQPNLSKKQSPRMSKVEEQKREKNELQLSGNLNDGNFILVRITQKNFFVGIGKKKTQKKTQPQAIYYSKYCEGIKMCQHEQLLPEKVMRYISSRAREFDTALDAISNSGSAAINFALEGCITIALSKSKHNLNLAKNNSAIYRAQKNIEFIQGDILDVQIYPDIIYVHPEYEQSTNSQSFSIFSHIRPDINRLLQAILLKSQNLILVLPKESEIHDIAVLFGYHLRKLNLYLSNQLLFPSNIDKIEIQQLQVDGLLHSYIVYLGKISNTQYQDSFEFLSRYILQDAADEAHFFKNLYLILKQAQQKTNFRNLMDLAIQCFEKTKKSQETILQQFLRQLILLRIIEKEDVYEQFIGSILQENTPQMKSQYHQSQNTFNPKFNESSSQQIESQEINFKKKKSFFSLNKNEQNLFKVQQDDISFQTSFQQIKQNAGSIDFCDGSVNRIDFTEILQQKDYRISKEREEI